MPSPSGGCSRWSRWTPGCCSWTPASILTSAGAAAGVDLCLHLIRRDHGSAVANQVGARLRRAAVAGRRQAQYIERPVPEVSDAGTAATRAWALTRLTSRWRSTTWPRTPG